MPKWFPWVALALGGVWLASRLKKASGDKPEQEPRPKDSSGREFTTRSEASSEQRRRDLIEGNQLPRNPTADDVRDPNPGLSDLAVAVRRWRPELDLRYEACVPQDRRNTCNAVRAPWDRDIEGVGSGCGNRAMLRSIGDPSVTLFFARDTQVWGGFDCVSHPDIALFVSSKDQALWLCLDYGAGAVVTNPNVLRWRWSERRTAGVPAFSACAGTYDDGDLKVIRDGAWTNGVAGDEGAIPIPPVAPLLVDDGARGNWNYWIPGSIPLVELGPGNGTGEPFVMSDGSGITVFRQTTQGLKRRLVGVKERLQQALERDAQTDPLRAFRSGITH